MLLLSVILVLGHVCNIIKSSTTAAKPTAKQCNGIKNNIIAFVFLKESSTEESPLERAACWSDALTEILHCVQNDLQI